MSELPRWGRSLPYQRAHWVEASGRAICGRYIGKYHTPDQGDAPHCKHCLRVLGRRPQAEESVAHRSVSGSGTVTIFYRGGREWRVEHPTTAAYASIIQSASSDCFVLVLGAPGYNAGGIVLPGSAGEGGAFLLASAFVDAWAREGG